MKDEKAGVSPGDGLGGLRRSCEAIELLIRFGLASLTLLIWWSSLPEAFSNLNKAVSVNNSTVSVNFQQAKSDFERLLLFLGSGEQQALQAIKVTLIAFVFLCFFIPFIIRPLSFLVIPTFWWKSLILLPTFENLDSVVNFIQNPSEARLQLITNSLIAIVLLAIIFLITRISLLDIIKLALKQVIFMSILFAIPFLFFQYMSPSISVEFFSSGGSERDIFIISAGVVVFLMATVYRSLPVSMIPSWVPILGLLNDMVAVLVMFLGLVMVAAGSYSYMNGSPLIDLAAIENMIRFFQLLKTSLFTSAPNQK